jgi:hypothetical protein
MDVARRPGRDAGLDRVRRHRLGYGPALAHRQHAAQRRVRDAGRDAVGHVERRHDHDAEPIVGKRRELAGEPVDRTVVAHSAAALPPRHEEAEAGALGRAGGRELRGPHPPDGSLAQQAAAAGQPASLEEHREQAREVADGGVQLPRGAGAEGE